MAWTKAQQKVIDTRNKNLLVSAAAGSGKTAVLVERIITMISEGDAPMDIDRLLVVTFTNAAAAQMRDRIGKALDKKLLEEPDNEHLQKQLSLLQSAQITTIHSFCLNVIRNYFHRIDLDPSFKIAEESEITLMKGDVISSVLERWYEEGREDFHEFIESYSHSKSDAPVEELILMLYQFAMSDPWPKEWLQDKLRMFEVDSLEDMNASTWIQELLANVVVLIGDLQKINAKAIEVCNGPGGPLAYNTALVADRELLEKLKKASSFQDYYTLMQDITYARLSGKKEDGVYPWLKDKVKALREEVKKGIKDLAGQYFFQSPEEMLKDLQAVRPVMQVLFELTQDFMEEFAKKKDEKNLIDFNDLEHFALKILVEEKENTKVPSLAALEISEQFEEIMIDEYQDSNLVQETILKAISREHLGIANRFMVGDVKQSIYKFRLAMPEIFLNKYKCYSTEDILPSGEVNPNQRIDLDKNFRSRRVVLDCVNVIFEQIMTEAVGDITYDTAASLKYGELFEELLANAENKSLIVHENISTKVFEETVVEKSDTEKFNKEESDTEETHTEQSDAEKYDYIDRISNHVELILVTEEERKASKEQEGNPSGMEHSIDYESDSVMEEEDAEAIVYTKKELEARAIAKRIKELVDPENGLQLFDRDSLTHYKATYKDIVILLRSMSGWSEILVNTLMQEGIPAYADTGTGYFQTIEIMTVLNMLRIIDNPRQDIPLTGVLYSPIVGLTTTQLAMIRASHRIGSMYTAVNAYVREGSDVELCEKLEEFITQLGSFRRMVKYIPIHELILEVLEKTGYYYYVLAMPGGDRRKANIDMLVSQAVRFEKGSYTGLFHFIRYMEKLHKYEVDFGEASTSGEQDNTVRIMSIHKSKGLEFPVVFVAGLSKQFNTQDLRNQIVLHSEYGVGPEYIDSKNRTKIPTLLKKVIQKKVQIENMGEELRVFYVAMTRAKEKLIMTGYLKSRDELVKKDFSFYEIMSSKSYLDLILPAIMNKLSGLTDQLGQSGCCQIDDFIIRILHKDEFLQEELIKQVFLSKDEEELNSLNPEQVYNTDIREEIKTRFNFIYPYKNAASLRVKMTVSELKKLGQFLDEEQSENLYLELNKDNSNGITPFLSDEGAVVSTSPEADSSEEVISELVEPELEATIPEFLKDQETVTSGTDRGTLYHKVLELMDLNDIRSKEELSLQLNDMVKRKQLKTEEVKKLKQDYIFKFIQSDVAERMRIAQAKGKLYKEKQFVMGIPADEIQKDLDSNELILIQGIIDVFFEEEDGLVLLDYKSDRLDEESLFVKRYQVQLQYYRKALEQILKKKVKEMIIYSLYLGKEIRID